MLWLAFVGLGLIGAGAVFGILSAVQYLDYEQKADAIMEEWAKCVPPSYNPGKGCSGGALALAANSSILNDSFNSMIIGASLGSIGVAIFAVGYQRSWITSVFHKPKPINRT